jgi:hypothetical protein
VLAFRFSTRDGSVRGIEAFEVGDLVDFVSGDNEFWLYEFDEAGEPEFERPEQVSEGLQGGDCTYLFP